MAGEKQFESVLLVEDDASHALLIRRALADFTGTITEARTWTPKRVEYNVAEVQARIRSAGLPEKHAVRIAEGW